jgi:hypothetical protein
MGEMAANALLTYIEPHIEPQTRREMPATLIVQPDFVVRNSTARVPTKARQSEGAALKAKA